MRAIRGGARAKAEHAKEGLVMLYLTGQGSDLISIIMNQELTSTCRGLSAGTAELCLLFLPPPPPLAEANLASSRAWCVNASVCVCVHVHVV